MATNKNTKPFNLLYKIDAQKTGIDKLYDFVTIQGRYIVVCVMFFIILAFLYRFPLDKKLNDEINRANDAIAELDYYSSNENERVYRTVMSRIESVEKFMEIYPSVINAGTELNGQIKFADLIKRIREIHEEEFKNDIIIAEYSYQSSPQSEGSLRITGSSTTFAKAEEFRQKLRNEKLYIYDVFINNLGSTKDGVPKFGLEIKLK